MRHLEPRTKNYACTRVYVGGIFRRHCFVVLLVLTPLAANRDALLAFGPVDVFSCLSNDSTLLDVLVSALALVLSGCRTLPRNAFMLFLSLIFRLLLHPLLSLLSLLITVGSSPVFGIVSSLHGILYLNLLLRYFVCGCLA